MCRKCIEKLSQYLIHIDETIRDFKVLYTTWSTERDGVIYFLDVKASKLDNSKRRFDFINLSGASAGFLGGALTVTGILLTPFTLGASTSLTLTGIGIGVAGGATSAGGAFAQLGMNRSEKKKVISMLESHKLRTCSLSELIDKLSLAQQELEKFTAMQCEEFRWKDVTALLEDLTAAGTVGRSTATFVSESLKLGQGGGLVFMASGGEVLMANVPIASAVIPILTTATGQSLLAGISIVFNLFSINASARDLEEGSKSQLATELRNQAEKLNDERTEVYEKFKFFLDATSTNGVDGQAENDSAEPER